MTAPDEPTAERPLQGRVLVVEDDPNIRDLVVLHLGLEGLTAVAVGDGTDALRLAKAEPFDLIVLDVMLPGLDGVTVCRAIRRDSMNGDVPILMLTARRDESDKVLGLESGADDYLTKPFGVGELLARVRAVLRRGSARSAGAEQAVFEVEGLRADLAHRRVFMHGQEIHLTPTEYRMLTTLIRHAGKVLTHRQLLREVWGPQASEETHYLRVYMGQLRQKLGDDAARPRYLLTEPGVGYRLAAE
jgi:two-component system KDP operon response regulator KdpE